MNFSSFPKAARLSLGALGYILAIEEVCRQMKTLHVEFDYVISAVGSGVTMAGMPLGKSPYGLKAQIHGINVCYGSGLYCQGDVWLRGSNSQRALCQTGKVLVWHTDGIFGLFPKRGLFFLRRPDIY